VCWQVLDKYKIAESKMRPWIQKKLIGYLGKLVYLTKPRICELVNWFT
jgi:hypothetical protein